MKFSHEHPNCKWHNWLAYDLIEKSLIKHSNHYSGVLYDLGAGESFYKSFFLQYADKYIAVEWDSSYHNTKADVNADLNKTLPIASSVADTIVSISVLEHLVDPQKMLNEACRILKPGGSIVLQVPWQWHIHEAPYDYYRYTPYGLKHIFSTAGFSDINVFPQSGFFSMMVLKANYASMRIIRGPRLLRGASKLLLIPLWFLGQKLAPLADKFDRNWASESFGYFVTAKKRDD
jgi:SAM-dependent methyltransferase